MEKDMELTPQDIIAELRRRALSESGISTEEVERRRREWDSNPPCPDCGSREHFEC